MWYAVNRAYEDDRASRSDVVVVPAFSSARGTAPMTTDPLFDCVAAILIGSQVGIAHGHRLRAPGALDDLLSTFSDADDPVSAAYIIGGDPILFTRYTLRLLSEGIPMRGAFCDGWFTGSEPILGNRKEVLITDGELRVYTPRMRRYSLRREDEASAKTSWRSSAGVSMR